MINPIDKILTEWAYRVYDGMPDPSDNYHLIQLDEYLTELRVPRRFREVLLNRMRGLKEDDIVQNKKSGNTYVVKKHNKKTQNLVTKDASQDDIDNIEPAGEPEKVKLSPEDKVKKDINDKTLVAERGVYNLIDSPKFNMNTDAATKEKLKKLTSKALGGQTLTNQEANYLKDWVRVVEPTDETESSKPKYKIYVARNKGDFRRTTGKMRAEKVDMKQSSAAKIVHRNLQKAGLKTQRISTFGGKLSAPNQIYATDGKVRIIKQKPVLGINETKEVKEAKKLIKNAPKSLKKDSQQWKDLIEAKKKVAEWARQANSVQIGKLKIVKQDLSLFKKGSNEYKSAARNNREMAELAEKIALDEMDFIDMDAGVYPDTSENRVTVIKSAMGNMLGHFNDLAKKPIAPGVPAADLSDESQRILDKLVVFATADPNGNGAPFKTSQDWMDNFEATMSEFANNDPLSEGWANFAEVYTSIRAMQSNGQGTENGKCSLLPESSTLETVDVVEIGGGKGKRKYVTLDGVSVKKGKGGASALTSKIKKAVMENDPDGELRTRIIQMSQQHTEIYGPNIDHTKYRQKMMNVATDAGVDSKWIKAVEDSSKTSKKVDAALSTMMENRAKDAPKDKKSKEYADFVKNEEKVKVELKERLQSYYIYTYLSHMAYNQAVLGQDFDNDSILSQGGDSAIKRYNPATGKKEPYIDTGSTLVEEKRIEIDSSDGINVLAYARPTFDVGFDNNGRSSNPGSGRLKNMARKPDWDFYKGVL